METDGQLKEGCGNCQICEEGEKKEGRKLLEKDAEGTKNRWEVNYAYGKWQMLREKIKAGNLYYKNMERETENKWMES